MRKLFNLCIRLRRLTGESFVVICRRRGCYEVYRNFDLVRSFKSVDDTASFLNTFFL